MGNFMVFVQLFFVKSLTFSWESGAVLRSTTDHTDLSS